MSPRTTVVLLVLLAIAGGAIWWFNRGEVPVTDQGRRLLPGLATNTVTRMTITPEREDAPFREPIVITRSGPDAWSVAFGGEPPFRARAEKVRALLETLREASFLRELSGASKDALGRHGLGQGQRVLVEVALEGGARRTLAVGAVVSERGVAALPDERWPPVEIDRQILDDILAGPDALRERRIVPFDSTLAQTLRVTFPKRPDAAFAAVRESGQWEIREPSLFPADQTMLPRLIASLSGLESLGPYVAAGGKETDVLVRYELAVQGQDAPAVVEIGDAQKDDLVPARGGSGEPWATVSLAGLDLIGQPVGQFRSRRLLGIEAQDIKSIVVARGDEQLLHVRRSGARLHYVPPQAWNWSLHGPLELPVDPSAQADLLALVSRLDAADFTTGPAFSAEMSLDVRHGDGDSEAKIRFGPDEGGLRAFARFGAAAEGHVRTSATQFLERPYYEYLARQANASAWFSLTTVEVEEVGRRKVVISAIRTDGLGPEFLLTEPHGDQRRKVPKEIVNPVADKIALLTVERFVGHGDGPKSGLDKPQYVIRWLDSGKSQGVPPDPKVGAWVTWRVGARGSDGLSAGELSSAPGLVFKTASRDLDPFQSLLEWASR